MTLLLEEMSEKDTVPYLINANFLLIFRFCQHERIFQTVISKCGLQRISATYTWTQCIDAVSVPGFLGTGRKLPLTTGVLLSSKEIYALSSPLE